LCLPSAFITQMASPLPHAIRRLSGDHEGRKTIRGPSGEKSGSKSLPRPERVMRRRLLPSAFTTQMPPSRML